MRHRLRAKAAGNSYPHPPTATAPVVDSTRTKEVRPIAVHVRTKNNARLIQRNLFLFVMVTKYDAYIDGFLGPQKEDATDRWAAKVQGET